MKKNLLLIFALIFSLASLKANNSRETFEVGNKTFLLNGKPFIIKAAELHYARIPKPYWEHRIKMCKALGMNSICLYVFWNYHEETEGNFNFMDDHNIAEFCEIAKKNGMYIILRPGPYACAEWEMGGLPWWLLKKKDLYVRSLDPYFMERTEIYMKQLGKHLAKSQITQGGNIILVQVENEFGAYGTDKKYIGAVRDIVRKSGFDVNLFQCDWSSTFQLNALDDLLWTLNFGTGANIAEQFKELERVRPETPLMCSEYWSGWFDHWGRKHETRPAKVMVEGIKDMLDRNISFSLYMTHGGTTFGHWGGANSPTYSAMCSSYDYDAPISESGLATEKYKLLRNLLDKYKPEGSTLPAVPEALPVIELPEIKFTKMASVFDNLPKPVLSKEIKPMEEFNQGWGSILYRTTLPEVEANTLLRITEVHDWAQVYVNGKLLARLDRRHDENQITLPKLAKGTRLDILVEAMGRVNFGATIHDRKGITEKVELIKNRNSSTLENWKVYNMPVDYSFAVNKKYISGVVKDAPQYYKATFNLTKTGDTFLDMQTWGKGMVWVNGRNLGRFWEIGPQQTLFLPGCWLKEGNNEIIVLEMKGPSKASIKGLKAPLLDILREKAPKTHRKEGEKLILDQEQSIHEAMFTPGNGWQKIQFSNKATGRYFCLEALSAQDGKKLAAVAELEILDTNGKPMPRESWKIIYADSEEAAKGNTTADKIYDLQESTSWLTGRNVDYPHHLVIDLGESKTISGFSYLPSAETNYPGMIKNYKIYFKATPFKY